MFASRSDLGLLILRIFFGGFMLVGHGWVKLSNFNDLAPKFPDPFGISHTASAFAAVAAESGCALLVMIGLFTVWACLPLIFTMGVAAMIIHAQGPWFLPGEGAKEPALLYLAAFLVIFLLGPGKYSVDAKLGRVKKR